MPLPDVVSGLLLRVSCEFDSRRGCHLGLQTGQNSLQTFLFIFSIFPFLSSLKMKEQKGGMAMDDTAIIKLFQDRSQNAVSAASAILMTALSMKENNVYVY